MPAKSRSRLTSVAPSASAVAAIHQVVFVQREAALLASQLNGRVKISRPFRNRFAVQEGQELVAGLFQLRAPSTCWQSDNPKKHFASNNRTGNHAIALVQPSHPILDLWGCPHQIADRVCVQQVRHAGGHLSKGSWSRTGNRAAAIAASRSSTAAALGWRISRTARHKAC